LPARMRKIKFFMDAENLATIGLTDLNAQMTGYMHYSHGNDVLMYHAYYFFDHLLDTLRNCSHEYGLCIFEAMVPKFWEFIPEKVDKLKRILHKVGEEESFIRRLIEEHVNYSLGRIRPITRNDDFKIDME
jgi:hypothetical protein